MPNEAKNFSPEELEAEKARMEEATRRLATEYSDTAGVVDIYKKPKFEVTTKFSNEDDIAA